MSSYPFAPQPCDLSERSPRVLVVDEDEGDLRVLRLILEGQGYEVFTCTTYETGICCLEKIPFDFVVVSQGSQAFEGRRVLGRAIQLDRHRPVLVLTRFLDMACSLEAMQMGALDYLKKPIHPLELLRYVRAHTRREGGQYRVSAA